MRRALLFVGAILLGVVATGCLAPEPTPGPVARPTDAGELFVQVTTSGGLLPPLDAERSLPAISIYADGLVLVPASVPEIFPGPAGHKLAAFRIDAELLDAIAADAVAIGLRGPDRNLPQEGPEFVVDGGATRITVVTGGVRHTTIVDALFDVDAGSDPERRSVAEFTEKLLALPTAAAATDPYAASGYRVYVAAADPGFGPDLEEAREVPWPSTSRSPNGASPWRPTA